MPSCRLRVITLVTTDKRDGQPEARNLQQEFYFFKSLQYAVEREQILKNMERARAVERYLAYHDTLTKLPNRHLFLDRLMQSIAYARRNGTSVAVLFIDLDER